jgi:hypothetical protein
MILDLFVLSSVNPFAAELSSAILVGPVFLPSSVRICLMCAPCWPKWKHDPVFAPEAEAITTLHTILLFRALGRLVWGCPTSVHHYPFSLTYSSS